jgi:hypothetical protein
MKTLLDLFKQVTQKEEFDSIKIHQLPYLQA